MKFLSSPRKARLLIPVLGILGLLLRRLLTATGIDDKGLLRAGHPAWIALLILSAVTAAVIALCVRHVRGTGSYRVSFPPSILTTAGYIPAAACAALTALAYWADGTGMSIAYNPVITAAGVLKGLVLVLTPVAMLLLALCRCKGRKPIFGLHVLVCIYFALQSLTLYQTWSFDPQLQDYCFQLFACIALTMTAYQLAMFDNGKGSHRRLWLWSLAAVYLCCVSVSSDLFYLTGAFWAFTALSRLRRRRPRKAPQTVTTEEVYYPD